MILATEETDELISSFKVEGTDVADRSGTRLGIIRNLMISKRNGTAEYAVLEIAAMHGRGAVLFPIPWSKLRYDSELSAYVLNVDLSRLFAAPHYGPGAPPAYNDQYGMQVHSYWDAPYPSC